MRTLDKLFKAKLTELALCANGPAVAFDREQVKGGERLNIPKNYGNLCLDFLRRYQGAPSDSIRLRIIADLQDELRKETVKPVRDLHPNTLEWKVAITRDRRNEWTVAYAYGCSVKTVREARAEIRERLVAALERDASIRTVAAEFGVSKSYVGKLRLAA